MPGDIVVQLDEVLASRGMTLTHLAQEIGITLANASILKRNASVCGYSTNAALLMDYSAFSPCLLGYPQTKGMVIHLPVRELISAF